MRKSNAILFIILVSFIMFYIENGLIANVVLRIQITILTIGYFIVRQLEENKR